MNTRKVCLIFLSVCVLILFSGCGISPQSAYEQGLKLFAKADYADAAEKFDQAGNYLNASTYAAYSHGLKLYEQARYAEAEAFFAKCDGFMYATERKQYCHASALQEKESYLEASEAFLAMTDYEDAYQRGQYCKGLNAEAAEDSITALYAFMESGSYEDSEDRLFAIQGNMYNQAIELKQNGQAAEAVTYFVLLGDYLNSAEYAIECKEIQRDETYLQAETLNDAGDHETAYQLFSSLGGYRDAAARAEELAEKYHLDGH